MKFNEYIIGLRNGVAHFGERNSLKFLNEKGKIKAVEIIGTTNRKKKHHEIKYKFNLANGNEIEDAVKEILKHINI